MRIAETSCSGQRNVSVRDDGDVARVCIDAAIAAIADLGIIAVPQQADRAARGYFDGAGIAARRLAVAAIADLSVIVVAVAASHDDIAADVDRDVASIVAGCKHASVTYLGVKDVRIVRCRRSRYVEVSRSIHDDGARPAATSETDLRIAVVRL